MYASELKKIVKGSGFPQWKIAESMGAIEWLTEYLINTQSLLVPQIKGV